MERYPVGEYMTEMIYKLPGSLKQAIQRRAELEKISASELVRKAVKRYLKDLELNADLSEAS
jgi:hypothetical protein